MNNDRPVKQPNKKPRNSPEEIKKQVSANPGYSLSNLHVNTSSNISFDYSCPDNPWDNWEWWAFYRGHVPDWSNEGEYLTWNWICPFKNNCTSSGHKTEDVRIMVSDAIYTLALYKYEWDIVDYIEFNASW